MFCAFLGTGPLSRDKDKELHAVLGGLGFTPENHQTWTLWRLPEPLTVRPPSKVQGKASKRHPSQLPSPWRISHIELAEQKNTLKLHRLRIELDQKALLANLDALTKKYFGSRTIADFVYTVDGSVWCLFEFTNPNYKERDGEAPRPGEAPPPLAGVTAQGRGFAGFKCRVVAEGSQAQVVVSELFGCGFVPHAFASMPLRFWADAISLRTLGQLTVQEFAPASLYELSFPLIVPVLIHLGECGVSPTHLLALQAALGKTRAAYSPTVLAGEAGFVLCLGGDVVEGDAAMSEVVLTPLEVLEAREKADVCRPIDGLISAGKLNEALQAARRQFDLSSQALFIMRRLALLQVIGVSGDYPDFAAAALRREGEHKLFLSAAASLAIKSGDRPRILENLSFLGGLLMDDVRSAEHLFTFELVLPELLGDAWSSESPDKASDCYHRVVEKRGDMPRVLRKLIYLARVSHKAASESAYLHRLAAVERRRGELARLNFRLAELRSVAPGGSEEAISLSQKALKLDLNMHEAALLTAVLQVEKGRFEEAIKGLDRLLKDKNLSLSVTGRHAMEAMIGRIWNHNLGRPDLAERRYEAAIGYNALDLTSLRELERIYRHFARKADLARILDMQFSYYEKHQNPEQLKPLFDELVVLYRGELNQPKRALELYQRLLAASTIEAPDLDLLLGWNDLAIDWPAIYTKLLAKLQSVPPGKRRADVLCRLAEICRDKLGDDAAAIRHLHAANREGWIDSSGFAFLIEKMAKEQDYKSLVQIYQRRIKQVPAAEQHQLLLELLSLPGELTDLQRDVLAVQILNIDQEADTPVKQRFERYQGEDDVKGIARILAILLEQRQLTSFEQIKWIDYALQCLAGCDSRERFVHMDVLYRRQLQLSEDQVGILQKALASLYEGGDRDSLIFYVQALLGHGLLPNLTERAVEALLDKQDQDLALYHELMSMKAQVASIAATHARIAAVLYAKRRFQEAKTERMLARLCVLVACAEDDLIELRALVSRSGHWSLLAKALQKQADLEDERRRKFKLLEQLGIVYWHEINDHGRARQTFRAALALAPEPHKIKLLLATLAGEMDDREDEIKQYFDFLQDAASTLDVPAMTRSVGRLLKLNEDASTIQRLIQPHVELAYNRGLWEMAGRLAAVLLDNGLVSSELHKIAMKAAIVARQPDQVINHWWRGLACVANKSKLRVYLAETSALLEKSEFKHLMLACYQAAFEHQIGDRIGPKIKHELILQYAAILFDQEATRATAMTVYAEACAAEPDDYRTWMPLYFLLIEYGTPSERLEHLRVILPKLKADPRPLKSFPLTIESLQVEVNELEKQLKQDIKQGRPKPARDAAASLPPLSKAGYSPVVAAPSNVPLSLHSVKAAAPVQKPAAELQLPVAADPVTPGGSLPEVRSPVQADVYRRDADAQGESEVAAQAEQYDPILPGGMSWDLDAQPGLTFEGAEEPPSEATPPAMTSGPSISVAARADVGIAPLAQDGGTVLPMKRQAPAPMVAQEAAANATIKPMLLQDLDFSVQHVGGEGLGFGSSAQVAVPAPPTFDLTEESAGGLPLDLGMFVLPNAKAPPAPKSPMGDGITPIAPSLDLGPLAGPSPMSLPSFDLQMGPFAAAGESEAGAFHAAQAAVRPEAPAPDRTGVELNLYEAIEVDAPVAFDLEQTEAPPETGQGSEESPMAPEDVQLSDDELSLYEEGQSPPPRTKPKWPETSDMIQSVDLEPGQAEVSIQDNDASSAVAPSDNDMTVAMAASPAGAAYSDLGTRPEEDRSGDTMSVAPRKPVFGVNVGTEGAESDWRLAVIKGDFNADLTSRLLQQAFASELEKHLAIQCVALVGGNCDRLSQWHWRVWRKPDEFGYPLNGKDRFPAQSSPPILHSTLHKFIIMATPLLVKVFRDRFSLGLLQKKLSLSSAQLNKLRKPLAWDKGLLKEVGLHLFAERLSEQNFQIFSLNGLGGELFYDGLRRAIYLDEVYFRKVPPSHLFHRLLGLIWSIRVHYFVPLALNPRRDVIPFLGRLHVHMSRQGFSKLKSQLSGGSNFDKELQGADLRSLRDVHEKLGMPTDEQVLQLWEAMQTHLYRMLLAETLDVIGLFESLLNDDLLRVNGLKHSEIYQRSPYCKGLIEFITKLKV